MRLIRENPCNSFSLLFQAEPEMVFPPVARPAAASGVAPDARKMLRITGKNFELAGPPSGGPEGNASIRGSICVIRDETISPPPAVPRTLHRTRLE